MTEVLEASIFDLTSSGHSLGVKVSNAAQGADRGFLRLFNLQVLREDPC